MTISGFGYERVPVGDVRLGVAHGGAGPPVVLLHGFPQTHLAWRHLFLLAHPPPLPERLLAVAPSAFFGHFLDVWARDPAAIPPEVRAAYLAAASAPEAIAAVCAD